MVTLSTAEAELTEVIEGMIAGESIGVIVDELFGAVDRMSWTDSQSGLSILTTDGGNWRTRHLRLRATFARQAIQQGLWHLGHIHGEHMIADIGTKALASTRFEQLKKKLKMAGKETGEEAPEKGKEDESRIHQG